MLIHTQGGIDLYQDDVDSTKFIISFPKDDFQKILTGTEYTHITSVLNCINFEDQKVEGLRRKTVSARDIDVEFGEYLRIYYNFDEGVKSLAWISDYETAREWDHDLLEVNPENIERDE